MIGSGPSASTEHCYRRCRFRPRDTMTGTDYSDPGNWLRIPDVIHDVDTFYLYPTTYINPSFGAPDVCDIDDPIMLAGALDKLVGQASAFEKSPTSSRRYTGRPTSSRWSVWTTTSCTLISTGCRERMCSPPWTTTSSTSTTATRSSWPDTPRGR